MSRKSYNNISNAIKVSLEKVAENSISKAALELRNKKGEDVGE